MSITYRATFIGRKRGAIGIFYPIATTVSADTPEAAEAAIWAEYEPYVMRVTLTPIEPAPEGGTQ